MAINTTANRTRDELKAYFVKNAIPTESQFADLINGILSQRDDGIAKPKGDPLSIEASGDPASTKKAINFYQSFTDRDPSWVLSLNPRVNSTAKPGLTISDGDGNNRLFIDRNSGNVGIGTITPADKLEVAGSLRISGNLTVSSGTVTAKGFVGDGSGLTGLNITGSTISLNIGGTFTATGAITPSVGNAKGKGIFFPEYPGGGGLDAAWIRYYVRSGESCTLEMGISNDEDDDIALMPSGNVGIGINTPADKLEVAGSLRILTGSGSNPIRFTSVYSAFTDGGTNQAEISNDTGSFKTLMILGNKSNDQKTRRVSVWDRLDVNGDLGVSGNVGIGTTDPRKGKLHIEGSASTDIPGYAYYAYRSTETKPYTDVHGESVSPYSIWADNRIAALEFNAFSDARIKHVVGRSDAAQDLATLMKLKVTDYIFRDKVARGDRPQKKLIGQELKSVYPQAVSLSTDVVPDIYRTAAASDGWIEIDTTLQKGDRVSIISKNGSEAIVEVTDVARNGFRVSPGLWDGPVFVYGREVNDFHVVDYDAIAILNLSATQQIKREKDAEISAVQQDLAAIVEQNVALSARLDRLERNVEEFALAPR